ncbi:hypothetical protein Peur_028159 [Populus x canadensis]
MVQSAEGTRAIALELCREFEDKFLQHIMTGEGSGWKIVASFEGNFPNRIKELPLDRHFDINNVKRIVLEADGYQPYLISPEKGLRSLIKIVLELAKEPSRLCVDEGQGYSLSADIQYVDARWEIPVVLPLRDCTSQELNLLCQLDGLKTLQLFDSTPSGINGLISSFVNVLQEENSSRECTILRTAGKLTPFEFNRIPETDNCNVPLAIRRRQKRYNLKTKESISSELFCPICNGPLKNFNSLNLSSLKSCQSSRFNAACCSSCQFQIIPKDPSSMENFSSLLPQQVVDRAKHGNCSNLSLLREQIQDCLLSDSEDET